MLGGINDIVGAAQDILRGLDSPRSLVDQGLVRARLQMRTIGVDQGRPPVENNTTSTMLGNFRK